MAVTSTQGSGYYYHSGSSICRQMEHVTGIPSWVRSLPFPLRLREELPVVGLHSWVGFLAELHVQPVPLGELPSWTELLAIFHIWMGPLSGSQITPGQVGPQAVLPNLGGTPSGLYIKAGPQAYLYSWVDQGGCSTLGEVVGWIFWSRGDASCTPQLGGDEYALGLRRISILASSSGRDTSYALQLGRVTDWGPYIREATGSRAIPQDHMP